MNDKLEAIYRLRHDLQTGLRQDLRTVLDKTDSSLVFGHLCRGVLDRAGALRMTQVQLAPKAHSLLGSLATEFDVQDHDLAFRQHIRMFGRNSTLLDWIALDFYEHHDIRADDYAPRKAAFLPDGKSPLELERKGDTLKVHIADHVLASLVPLDVIQKYLSYLYASVSHSGRSVDLRTKSSDEFHRSLLVGCRYSAFEVIRQDATSRASLDAWIQLYRTKVGGFADAKDDSLIWLFISALQTAFMYVLSAQTVEDASWSFGIVTSGGIHHGALPADTKKTFNAYDFPLSMISGIVRDSTNADERLEMIGYYHKHGVLSGRIPPLKFLSIPIAQLARAKAPNWNHDLVRATADDGLKRCFTSHFLDAWPLGASIWLSLLVERLRGTVHEGQALSFCFVLADKSQIEDSPDFELLELDGFESEDPFASDGKSDPSAHLEKALSGTVRQVAKKNYAWFHEGRYALFWDVTFPQRGPTHLIRLRNSSWNVFTSSSRHGEALPPAGEAIVVSYLRTDGSGGLIIKGEQLLSFRRTGRWYGNHSRRVADLHRYFEHGLRGSWLAANKATSSKLMRAVLAIAEDPHMGCMLVVLKEGQTPYTQSMGEVWTLTAAKSDKAAGKGVRLDRMGVSELISLMAMDGATCVWKHENQEFIAFRQLVAVSDKSRLLLRTDHEQEHLAGEGSRKWSGALAATRRDVLMVITVSQDGPIYVYAPRKIADKVNGMNKGLSSARGSENVFVFPLAADTDSDMS